MAIEKFNFKEAIIVTLIFTALDYIVHVIGILPEIPALPEGYFIFKVIALPLILVFLSTRANFKGFLIYPLVAVILQVRYYFLDIYDVNINIMMIVIHYLAIILSVYFYNKFFRGG